MHGVDPSILPHLQAIARATSESLAFIFLNRAGVALGMYLAPATAISAVDVPLRAIVAAAIGHGASDLIMAHNHPSGDPEPSPEDLRTTRRVATALDALGIRLVDHLVLAGSASVSFRDRGLL